MSYLSLILTTLCFHLDFYFSSSEVWTANKANRSKRDFVYLSYYLVSFAHPMSSHPLSIFFFTWKIKRELRENILFSIWNYIFILQSSKNDKKGNRLIIIQVADIISWCFSYLWWNILFNFWININVDFFLHFLGHKVKINHKMSFIIKRTSFNKKLK